MASISSLGVGSNLDLKTLLDNMVAAEKEAPQALITSRQSLATATISALGSVKSKLSALQTAMAKLKDTSYFGTKTATSSDTNTFTVSADTTADAGSYDISVINLAKANKIASGNFSSAGAQPGSGKLTIGVGGATFDVNIAAGTSLSGIRDAINNASGNTGVKASILTVSDGAGGTASKLVFTASNTGASSQISITATDDDGNNTDGTGLSQLAYTKGSAPGLFTEVNAAQDATITIDGFSATSSTNEFKGAISGVTITAVKGATDPNDPTTAPSGTLAVTVDTATIATTIKSFVTAYNDYAKTLSTLVTPSKDSTDTSTGALSGDSSLLSVRSQLKQIIASPVTGAASNFSTLAFLGISTNTDGTLTVDDTKLNAALTSRPDDVKKLFTGTDGIATKFDSLISNLTGSGGLFQTRTDSLNTQLRSLTNQQTQLDARIASFTARYQKQFTALDSVVSQLNSTGTFLTQQLDATSKIISRKST